MTHWPAQLHQFIVKTKDSSDCNKVLKLSYVPQSLSPQGITGVGDRWSCYLFYFWGGQGLKNKIQVITKFSECFLYVFFINLEKKLYYFAGLWFSLLLCSSDFYGFSLLLSQIILKRLINLKGLFRSNTQMTVVLLALQSLQLQIQNIQK